MYNKFNVDDTVLYKKGEHYELGVVKEVIVLTPEVLQVDMFGLESVVKTPEYAYRVWYHTGDTTAVTNESYLRIIANAYAFNITRKLAL